MAAEGTGFLVLFFSNFRADYQLSTKSSNNLDFFASLEGKSTGWNSNRMRISNRVFHTGEVSQIVGSSGDDTAISG